MTATSKTAVGLEGSVSSTVEGRIERAANSRITKHGGALVYEAGPYGAGQRRWSVYQ